MLKQLVDDLRLRPPLERGEAEMAALLAQASLQWTGERALLSRPGGYTRTCAYRDDRFEMLLLNWAPGASSAIHDHGGRHCWMVVLGGRVEVDDYVRLDDAGRPGYAEVERRGSRTLEAGGLEVRQGRFDLHRVSATSARPSVSLHVYSEPLSEFLIYHESARRCERVVGTYDEIIPIFWHAQAR